MNELRKKLFEIFLNSVIKEAQKISKVRASPQDAFDEALYDLEPCEWTQLHTKWKTKLKRLGITRITTKMKPSDHEVWKTLQSAKRMQLQCALPGRNIPGFYSIIDPLTTSERARTICFIDVPTELGDKILVLGELPT